MCTLGRLETLVYVRFVFEILEKGLKGALVYKGVTVGKQRHLEQDTARAFLLQRRDSVV